MRRWLLKLLAALPFAFGAARAAASDPPESEPPPPVDPDDQPPSPEALRRKAASIAVLRAEGVPINDWLPVIETEAEAMRRTKAEVAARALALLVVAAKAQGAPKATVDELVISHDLASDFSPKERAFIDDPTPSERDQANFVWRYEAAWTLLWALDYVPALEKPTHPCDPQVAIRLMMLNIRRSFIDGAALRPLTEILDQADRIYRYHWAVRNAQLAGGSAPAGLSSDVVVERHQALNWLIGYAENAPWDEVTTDT